MLRHSNQPLTRHLATVSVPRIIPPVFSASHSHPHSHSQRRPIPAAALGPCTCACRNAIPIPIRSNRASISTCTSTSTSTPTASSARTRAPTHGHISATGTGTRAFHTSTPNMKKNSYYELLGVDRSASKDEIKKAFYQKAKKYHPDVTKGDKDAEKRFAEISNAYTVLSDPQKRQQYDLMGEDPGAEQGGPGGFGGFGGAGGFPGGFRAEDIFAQMFGGRAAGPGNPFGGFAGFETGPGAAEGRRASRGSDLESSLRISFADAVEGCKRSIFVNAFTACHDCGGDGHKKGSTARTCGECNGSGQVTMRQMMFQIRQPCPACDGQGKVQPPCPPCDGQGIVREKREVSVTIPAGVDNGTVLRLVNQGDAGPYGGDRGHLFVRLEIEPHRYFRREGVDLHVDAQVPLVTALLGGTVDVPTMTGEVVLKVSAGTQPGEKRVIRGKGVRKLNSTDKGDLYVHMKVQLPTRLTDRQKELIRQLDLDSTSQTSTSTSTTGAGTGTGTGTSTSTGTSTRRSRARKSEPESASPSPSADRTSGAGGDDSSNGGLFGKVKGIFSSTTKS